MDYKGNNMYRITKNLRTRQTANIICEGFKNLLKEKSFEEITISDISAKTGCSRSTIYRLFDSVTDVLEYCIKVFVFSTIEKAKRSEIYTIKEFVISFIQDCQNDYDFLARIMFIQYGRFFNEMCNMYILEMQSLMPKVKELNTDDRVKSALSFFLFSLGSVIGSYYGNENKKAKEIYDETVDNFKIVGKIFFELD